MQNLKVRVSTDEESKEAQELLLGLGAKGSVVSDKSIRFVCTYCGVLTQYDFLPAVEFNEITLAELRAMVNPMKEWLNTKTFEYKQAACMFGHSEWIEIPEGAEIAILDDERLSFAKPINGGDDVLVFDVGLDLVWDTTKWDSWADFIDFGFDVVWQRPTQPEALPFIDDNPQSLNEQYAEIEQVRQAVKVKSGSDSDHAADAMSYGFMSNVNHPSHYTKGKVECIDAIESATVGKTGIDAVCVANVIKYLWRYEEKNGVEDIKKAEWYLQKLIENNI